MIWLFVGVLLGSIQVGYETSLTLGVMMNISLLMYSAYGVLITRKAIKKLENGKENGKYSS